jgi:hypothetical protein
MAQFTVLLSLALAAVFAVAAATKLTRHGFAQFAAMVVDLGVPVAASRPVAAAVVAAEVAVAGLLATPTAAPVATGLAVVLLGAFTAVTARVVHRGMTVTCRCFGSGTRITAAHVVRDAGLTALAALTLALHVGVDALWSPEAVLAGSVVAVLTAALVSGFDDLVELLGTGSPAPAGGPR